MLSLTLGPSRAVYWPLPRVETQKEITCGGGQIYLIWRRAPIQRSGALCDR